MHRAPHDDQPMHHHPNRDGLWVATACGCVVVLDEEGLQRLDGRSLSMGSHGYAQVWDGKVVLLHRWLMGLEVGDPLTVDHRNRDRLDNRIANLRVCTRAENNQNRRGQRIYRTPCGRYEAKVQMDGVRHFLGTFTTEQEARQAVVAFQSSIHHPVLAVGRCR